MLTIEQPISEYFYEQVGEGMLIEHPITAGCYVRPDGWKHWAFLEPCEDWDAADYRIQSQYGTKLAVNIRVTGSKVRRTPELRSRGVRIEITFVGDGEPDVRHSGWLELRGDFERVVDTK